MSEYHHRVGYYWDTGFEQHRQWVTVRFRTDPYQEINPFSEDDGSYIEEDFPLEHVNLVADTFFQALCYTNVWDPITTHSHGLTIYGEPHPIFKTGEYLQVLRRHLSDFATVRDLFEDLLHHEEIEQALAIPDIHGHTALEILVREAGVEHGVDMIRSLGHLTKTGTHFSQFRISIVPTNSILILSMEALFKFQKIKFIKLN